MTIYNGGGMTSYAKQLMMKEVKGRIDEIGLPVYDPSSQPFNNKQDMGNKDIARTIVAKDAEAIYNSTIHLMNTQEDNLGTCIEAGMIKGYQDQAVVVLNAMEEMTRDGFDAEYILDTLYEHCEAQILKEYIPYHTDIRIHDEAEAGFRRSVGFHQFLRGVNLFLGDYHKDFHEDYNFDGFFSLNDAMEKLEAIKESNTTKESPIQVEVTEVGNLIPHITHEAEVTA